MELENQEINIDSRADSRWSVNLDKLLRAWQRQTQQNEKLHRKQSTIFSRKFYWIGGTAIVVGSVTSSGEFASFTECSDGAWCDFKMWFRFILALATVVVTILAGLQTFLGYEGESKNHKEAANKYHALRNVIANILAFPPTQRGDPTEILNSIRNQFEDIINSSPNLPIEDVKEELDWTYGKTPPNTEIEFTENGENDENDESVKIDIDLDLGGTPFNTDMKMKEHLGKERCGLANNSNTYGVINQLRYQLERMENHTHH